MTDERIVEEWLDEWLRGLLSRHHGIQTTARHGSELSAALRGAGFDVYRPDDCPKVEVEDGGEYADYQTGERKRAEPILRGRMIQDTRCLLPTGTYRLVPVGGEG